MKTFLHSVTVVMLILLATAFTVTTAQNRDLPNPNHNIQAMPIGSFVIAMDKTYQNAPGYFNLKAYGLIVTLENAGVRLRWIIDSGKVKDAADFSVTAERILPSYVADNGIAKGFKAGPFVIFPSDTTIARSVINSYNNVLAASNRVYVYRTTALVNVDVRYDLIGVKPKAAILNDGGKGSIQVAFMVAAGIPSTNYAILDSAVSLSKSCYTFASEPHNDGKNGGITRIVDSIKAFVLRDGGNFLAQCHAISTYENFNEIQSTSGIEVSPIDIPSANVNYPNADLSFAQFDGTFIPNQTGAIQTWERMPGSSAINNFYPVINGNTSATDSIFGATVSKHKSGKGGLIFYLGNHSFSGNTDADINGQRMYMNAFLTPAAYASCPSLYLCGGGPACGPLPVTLNYFKAQKTTSQQVQLTWSTSTELNAKEFVVERSFDGISFVGITKLQANGFSNSEINYSFKDFAPASGFNYYRLTEISGDDRKSYSEIISVYFNKANTGIDIYPSPARQTVNVDMSGLTNVNNSISVYDLTGKIIINQLKVNSNSTKLDVSRFLQGTYILKAVGSDGTVLQNKFVVVRN